MTGLCVGKRRVREAARTKRRARTKQPAFAMQATRAGRRLAHPRRPAAHFRTAAACEDRPRAERATLGRPGGVAACPPVPKGTERTASTGTGVPVLAPAKKRWLLRPPDPPQEEHPRHDDRSIVHRPTNGHQYEPRPTASPAAKDLPATRTSPEQRRPHVQTLEAATTTIERWR